MANPKRGQAELVVGDKTYVLSFSINAICELEESVGETVNAIAAELNSPSSVKMKTIRAMFWAALRDHHPDVSLTDAGAIASECGIPAIIAAVGTAFARAFPEPEPAKEARPRKAARGTG